MIHEILALFATTEVFVYVFMEVIMRVDPVHKVLANRGKWYDYVLFALIFGGFSIFGTYTGIVLPSGAISSIRDLGPLVAGLIGGPWVGMGAGLIGGIDRYTIGGFTAVPCGLATFVAGLIGGIVFLINRRKPVGIWLAMVLAVVVEIVHGILVLLIVRPFADAWEAVYLAIPPMMIANGMGITISFIVIEREIKDIQEQERLESAT